MLEGTGGPLGLGSGPNLDFIEVLQFHLALRGPDGPREWAMEDSVTEVMEVAAVGSRKSSERVFGS